MGLGVVGLMLVIRIFVDFDAATDTWVVSALVVLFSAVVMAGLGEWILPPGQRRHDLGVRALRLTSLFLVTATAVVLLVLFALSFDP